MMRKRIFLLLAAAMVVAAPTFGKNPKNQKVKNVIFLIGDGMGLAAVTSWMVDQHYDMTAFDRAQYTGLCKTYSKNNRVTDSAASATALATGYKTDNSMVGRLPDGTDVPNITEMAKDKGLSTGIVITSYLLDGTPAGFTAHATNRGDREDIARDIVALKPDVIVGGGRKYFVDPQYTSENLIEKAKAEGVTYVSTPEEFYATRQTPILGLFSEDSYPMVIDRDSDFLTDAMNHTLDLLDDNKKGFFVMVEGSHIDHAAHANNAEQLLFEMEEFDKAVNAAFDYADTHKGTLVVVTADHETGGVVVVSNNKDFTKGESGIDIKFATGGHSGTLVPVYSYGAGADKFTGVYENTDIFQKIKALLIRK